jgi:hypothetical protein
MSVVTCRNEDCPSVNQPREMVLSWTDHNGTHEVTSVVCGACQVPITDLAETA